MDVDTTRYLRKLRLFQNIPDDVLAEMATTVERRHLAKDEILFRKGDPGASVYIVRTGWVKIVTEDKDGHELVLNHAGPAEVVGEMSLIDQEPRSAGVIALSPVEVLELKRGAFLNMLDKYPPLALDVMRNLARRVRFATTYIEQAIALSHRIAEGDYSFAMDQIQNVQSTIVDTRKEADVRANEMLSAFFRLVEGVKAREDSLKQQLRQLSIEIDESKRVQEVEKLTESTFFTNLKSAAQQLRQQREREDG